MSNLSASWKQAKIPEHPSLVKSIYKFMAVNQMSVKINHAAHQISPVFKLHKIQAVCFCY